MKRGEPLASAGRHDVPTGTALVRDALLNKGTAFSDRERDELRLRGLLPPRVFTLEKQVERAMGQCRRKPNALEKYIFLTTLQTRNETLFYRLLLDHLEELMPIIYTPTVGEACLEYGSIFRNPRGLWITIQDRGRVAEILRHWNRRGVRLIVATDGERILGLGDLGALGMGIPVGKLSLYTACAGIHPYYCLPITLDVGTDNQRLLEDPFYIGLNQRRVRGAEYEAFLDEFVDAVQSVFPGSLLQFEDFGNANAFRLLQRHRNRVCCFNDDIQGTAAVAVAGLASAVRVTGRPLEDQTLLFFGAGEAGTGIAELFVQELVSRGLTLDAARRRCWFVDSKGLLVKERGDTVVSHKAPFVQDARHCPDLAAAVHQVRPTALIGVAGVGPAFAPGILAEMAALNERPIIFALSNPTSKAECTAEEAYAGTQGRAVFASGSPFEPVTHGDTTFRPGQGNNVYIFPGVGLGALVTRARFVTDTMFLAAARALAERVGESDLAEGRVYPGLDRIREVSLSIAMAVAEEAYASGLAEQPRPDDLPAAIRAAMFEPAYQSLSTA